jgi:hypothetical protein
MAITVAPLTTTVMTSVDRAHSGVASGINNAVAETAGLLAVAVFGLAMSHSFNAQLERRIEGTSVTTEVRERILAQEPKLAAIEIPEAATSSQVESVKKAIGESFISGFRLVMFIGAGLAVLSAFFAWFTLRRPSKP